MFITSAQLDTKLESMQKSISEMFSSFAARLVGRVPFELDSTSVGVGTIPQPSVLNQQLNVQLPQLTQQNVQTVEAGLGSRNVTQTVSQPNTDDYYKCMDQFFKLRPLNFDGRGNPEETEKWVRQMEKFFDSLSCNEEYKIPLATLALFGVVENWWRALKANSEVPYDHQTWNWFLQAFHEQYFSESVKIEKELEFMALQQGDMTVSQYEIEFEDLARFVPMYQTDDRKKAMKFQGGLRPEIRNSIAPVRAVKFKEVVWIAKCTERNLLEQTRER